MKCFGIQCCIDLPQISDRNLFLMAFPKTEYMNDYTLSKGCGAA